MSRAREKQGRYKTEKSISPGTKRKEINKMLREQQVRAHMLPRVSVPGDQEKAHHHRIVEEKINDKKKDENINTSNNLQSRSQSQSQSQL